MPQLVFATSTESAQEIFQQANEQYAKKDYKKAVSNYQSLVDEGFQSFELYYNLGNAYFKSEEVAPALLYYYKAQKLQPGNEEVAFNIHFAEQQTIDKIETPHEFFIASWWKQIFMSTSISKWTTFLRISLFFSVFAFVAYLFLNQLKFRKIGFYSGSVLLLLTFFFFLAGNAQYRYFKNTQFGIIYSLSTTVRSTPSEGEKLFILHEGTKVKLLENIGDEVKIALPNGKEGWIPKDVVRAI